MTDPLTLPERVLVFLQATARDLPLSFGESCADRSIEAFSRIAGVTREEARRAFREAIASGAIILARSTEP